MMDQQVEHLRFSLKNKTKRINMIFEQTGRVVTLSSVILLNTMAVPFCTMYRPAFLTTVRVIKANTNFIFIFLSCSPMFMEACF